MFFSKLDLSKFFKEDNDPLSIMDRIAKFSFRKKTSSFLSEKKDMIVVMLIFSFISRLANNFLFIKGTLLCIFLKSILSFYPIDSISTLDINNMYIILIILLFISGNNIGGIHSEGEYSWEVSMSVIAFGLNEVHIFLESNGYKTILEEQIIPYVLRIIGTVYNILGIKIK